MVIAARVISSKQKTAIKKVNKVVGKDEKLIKIYDSNKISIQNFSPSDKNFQINLTNRLRQINPCPNAKKNNFIANTDD
jgi:hypothetical protein